MHFSPASSESCQAPNSLGLSAIVPLQPKSTIPKHLEMSLPLKTDCPIFWHCTKLFYCPYTSYDRVSLP